MFMNWRLSSKHTRAMLVGVCAAAAVFVCAGGWHTAAVWLLSAILILAEFTGGWLALAIATMLLGGASLLVAEPVQPLMLTALCAPLCVLAVRRGIPLIAPVALLAIAGVGAPALVAASARATWSPVLLATELLEATFNVALVTIFIVVRPPLRLWLPPMRRWRFEDLVFLVGAAALIPSVILMQGAAPVASASAWWVIG